MEDWIRQYALTAPYALVVGSLLAGGFGIPISEDLPIILAGYLCGQQLADPWILFPIVMASVISTDLITYSLGRRFGPRLLRLPGVRKVLHEKRIKRSQELLANRGAKFIFLTRFVPGLRSPVIFSSGTLRMPLHLFLRYDVAAAFVGVPPILAISFAFSGELDWLRERLFQGQLVAVGIVLVVLAIYLSLANLARRRLTAPKADPQADGRLDPESALRRT